MIIFSLFVNFYLNSLSFETLINSTISLALGFLLFYYNYWSAGDAKLFVALSLLIPISTYHFGRVSYFPSLSILINSFVPITIFYLIKGIPNIKIKNLVDKFKSEFKYKEFSNTILFLFGFPFIFSFFNVKLDVFTSSFTLFLLFQILKKISKKYNTILFGFLAVDYLIYNFQSVVSSVFILNFIETIILYETFTFILNFLSTLTFSSQIPINKLDNGMIVGEPLFFSKGSFFKKGRGEKISNLDDYHISLMKKLSSSGKLKFKSLSIEKTIPFAPFIFIGTLITYLIGGNLFSFIYLKYLKYLINLILG